MWDVISHQYFKSYLANSLLWNASTPINQLYVLYISIYATLYLYHTIYAKQTIKIYDIITVFYTDL